MSLTIIRASTWLLLFTARYQHTGMADSGETVTHKHIRRGLIISAGVQEGYV